MTLEVGYNGMGLEVSIAVRQIKRSVPRRAIAGLGHKVRGTGFQPSISLIIPGACWAEVGGVVRALRL